MIRLFALVLLFYGCVAQESEVKGELTPGAGNSGSPSTSSTTLTYSPSFRLPGTAFSFTPTATGQSEFIAIISPTLPPGLSFNGLTGAISGTPTTTTSETTYTVTVQGGAVRTTSTFTLLTDISAPSTVVINDGLSQTSTSTLSFSWTAATDAQSGIDRYEYAVATSPTLSDVVDWTSTTGTSVSLTGLSLTVGQSYFVRVRAINGVGGSSSAVSDGVLIYDSSTPIDGVWMSSAYSGDNWSQTYGMTFCTSTACVPVSTQTYSNAYIARVPTSLGSSLLLREYNIDANNPIVCNVVSGCNTVTSLKFDGNYSALAFGTDSYLSYGHLCNLGTQSCTVVSSPLSSYSSLSVLGGFWGAINSSGLVGFVNSTTGVTSPTAHTYFSSGFVATDPRTSIAWVVTYVTTTATVRRCQSDGSCTAPATFTYNGSVNVQMIAESNGNGVWIFHNGIVRYCTSGGCTSLLTGLPTHDFVYTKNSTGDGVWIKNSGSSTYYCTSSTCTTISTNGEIPAGGNSLASSGAFAYRSSPLRISYCTTSSCTTLRTFTTSPNWIYRDKVSNGIWVDDGSIHYCTTSTCTTLTNGTFNTQGDIRISPLTSRLWAVEPSTGIVRTCTTTACNVVTTLGTSPDGWYFQGN